MLTPTVVIPVCDGSTIIRFTTWLWAKIPPKFDYSSKCPERSMVFQPDINYARFKYFWILLLQGKDVITETKLSPKRDEVAVTREYHSESIYGKRIVRPD
jgi:hypothetical protein